MFFIVAILIMLSVYVAKNEKLSEQSRTGWFIFVGVIVLLVLVFSLLF